MKKNEKRTATIEAIIKGLEHGDEFHTKPYDRAVSIRVALTDAGLMIIRNYHHKKEDK